ncbi:MAG: hypothetical protein ACYC1A_01240 [Spirochaetales bacterium]
MSKRSSGSSTSKAFSTHNLREDVALNAVSIRDYRIGGFCH